MATKKVNPNAAREAFDDKMESCTRLVHQAIVEIAQIADFYDVPETMKGIILLAARMSAVTHGLAERSAIYFAKNKPAAASTVKSCCETYHTEVCSGMDAIRAIHEVVDPVSDGN